MGLRRGKGKRSLMLSLFGIPFFCFGIGFGYFKLWPELSIWMSAASWQQTEGQLVSTRLDSSRSSEGSTTYEVKARYRYQVNGREFESARVGIHTGKDNIGRYHQTWSRQLSQSHQNRLPVTVWYDPLQPSRSLLDRELRWGLMAMQLAFAGVFSLVGAVLMGAGLVKGNADPDSDPVPADADSMSTLDFSDRSPIAPSAAMGHWGMWFFAVVWNAISFPAALAGWDEIRSIRSAEDYLVLLILLFPLVGLFLIWQAIKGSILHVRYGQSRLVMDPNPGQAGGQVGGEITLSKALPLDAQCEVRLECLHSRETRNAKGERRTSTSVLWQDMMMASGRREADQTKIQFLFDVPGDLPASQPQSKDWKHWKVHVAADIPGLDLALDFAVPVAQGERRSLIRMPGRERQQQLQRTQELAQVLNTEQKGDTLYLNSEYGRERNGSIQAFLFGSIFLAAGIGIGFAQVGPALIAIPVKLLFCTVFGGVGLLIMLIGLLTPTTRLDTAIDRHHVHVRRQFLGREVYRRSIPLDSITRFDAHRNSSTSSGSRTRNWFQLRIHHDGRRQPIAESIPGRVLADEALAFLRTHTGLP
ncbi:MAG: DUF3592 domain-containing protein [Pseudomonadota bacterium]|nr:DUF3592 domain-containing protein [Pseudomonadota bacterium]